MFNYKEFKRKMVIKEHEVTKRGNIITISPENGYNGFQNAYEIVNGYENELIFKGMSHYNTHIYFAEFKIKTPTN